ncbi:hypothetical protein ACFL6X_00560 [Candidatus Latescibacterota bacterium]
MKTLLMAVALAACLAAPAPAQRGRGLSTSLGEAGLERLELLRMWRLIDQLEVDEEQAAKLFPLWSRHQRERRALQAERGKLGRELTRLLADEETGDGELEAQIAQVEAMDARIATASSDFHRQLATVLTARQRARLLLFPEQFRGELREVLKGIRDAPPFGGHRGFMFQGGGRPDAE